MSTAAARDTVLTDAELALHIFLHSPQLFGGIVLRGPGPVRDDMLAFAVSAMTARGPVVKIPINVDAERLLGGLDLSATLAAGHGVMRQGLLDAVAGGVLIVPMAERVGQDVAAYIAQALDGRNIAAILLDDACEPDEAPPAVLSERMAFCCDVAALRGFAGNAAHWPDAIHSNLVQPLSNDQLSALAATAAALGIGSVRALIFVHCTARAHAALHGRSISEADDVAAAVRLVLAPRATQLPPDAAQQEAQEQAEQDDAPSPDAPDTPDSEDDSARTIEDMDLEDIMLEAAAAAIPPHILDQIDQMQRGHGKGQAGRSGQKQQSAQRGRPKGARPGIPGNGRKLALIDSLRTAAPWQRMRREAAHALDSRKIHIRKSDLRVRHFEQRRESLTIFAVDASGSSALSRLAEAKGAVEMLLAEAYVKRAQVALIAFRQSAAEILLPPTRSLTRARRALSALPGGGGTPLAAGLIAAQQLASAAVKRGQTPVIAILTDGKANVLIDGTANRDLAMAEAQQSARAIAALGVHSIVIDISPRPRPEAAELAAALGGKYLALPRAQSAAMAAAISGIAESIST